MPQVPAQPLVSVIISFLNEERFLTEAIESVLHQHNDHWELILVDDGSKDNSTEIAKEYAARFKDQIFYKEHPGHANKGLSASRNFGLSFAKGELFAVLDADDVWLPEKLSVQCGIMKSFPEIAMICEASLYWNSWSEEEQKDEVILVGTGQDMVYYPPELLKVLYPLSEAAAPCPSGLMIRADKFRKHGGFEEHFRGKYQLYEDQAFLHKMYLNEPVYISSCCNNKYRQRIGSLVQKISQEGNYHVVRKYFLEWLEQYMKQNGILQKNLNNLVSKALKPYRHPNTVKIINFLRRVKRGLHRRLTGNQLC